MKKITLFIALLISSLGFSQTYDLLASLNGTNLEGTFGGTVAEYVTDPLGSDQVVRITSNPGEVWQGVNFNNFTSNFRLTSATQLTMQLDVYSTTAITIAPKAQGGVSGAPESITTASHTGSGTWETLTFTFNQSLDNKVPANGVYADFALHINWNTVANNFGAPDGRIFYIKNLKGLSAATPAALEPTDAPTTPPARAAGQVISLYGDAYGTAVGLTGVTWDNGSVAVEGSYAGNNALKITNGTGDFIGFDINGGSINATSMSHVHIDFWIAADYVVGQVLKVKLSNHANLPGTPGETSSIIKEAVPAATDVKKWFSLDLPLGTDVRNKIAQVLLIYTNSATPPAVLYVDNFYLYNDGSLSNKDFKIAGLNVYPNPSKNNWTIKTSNINMSAIKVYDILGKNVLSLTPNATEAAINGSSLKAGLYFAQIKTANGVSSIKLVKE